MIEIIVGHGVNPHCTCAWVFLVCMCDGCWLRVCACMLITMPFAIYLACKYKVTSLGSL